jgi:DNA-binding response OmpR family regulator
MNEPQLRVAVLDDDADFSRLLSHLLASEYAVATPRNGAHLCQLVDQGKIDCIVLDIGLPHEDGISIAQRIRTTSSIPILFLSGYSSEDMIVKGLNIGADDYVTKPFKSEVLLARVRSALRRGRELPAVVPSLKIQFDNVLFEIREQRLVNANGQVVKLTEMETLILSKLAQSDKQELTREELFRRIYGRDWDALNRGIEVHLSHLRRKLTKACGVENPIVGLRGVGYRLNLGSSSSS